MLGAIVHKAIKVVRSAFTDRTDDSLEVKANSVCYVANGARGELPILEINCVSLKQTVLGMFGTSIQLTTEFGAEIVLCGFSDTDARARKRAVEVAKSSALKAVAEKILRDRGNLLRTKSVEAKNALKYFETDKYISGRQMEKWISAWSGLHFLTELSRAQIEETKIGQGAVDKLLICKRVFEDPVGVRKKRNSKWIARTKKNMPRLVRSISDKPLTSRQVDAVLTDDNRVLAVAGAGTGKTATVVAKVNHLLVNRIRKPKQILVLSFNKEVVKEIEERIAGPTTRGVDVKTFHGLGMQIIQDATGKKQSPLNDMIQDVIRRIVNQMLDETQCEISKEILSFCIFRRTPQPRFDQFKTLLDRNQFAVQYDLRTLNGEQVKSVQELQIANWLWLNQIEYEYEKPYAGAATGDSRYRAYRPDFYLPVPGVYLEHFGIDRSGNTAPYIDSKKYASDMKWKRELHRKHETTMLETFSYQFSERTVFQELEKMLVGLGVELRLRTYAEMREHKEFSNSLNRFTRLVGRAMSLFREQRLSINSLAARFQKEDHRCNVFFKIFTELAGRYEQRLSERDEVDFGDMIVRAAKHVEAGEFQSQYKTIIVDEFQDISGGRAWLMNALIEQVDDSRLLCVGDDWQSIYRFNGSDVGLMTGFKETWDQAVRIDLDQTFRFNETINGLATSFITKNPRQLTKSVKAKSPHEGPAIYIVSGANEIQMLRRIIGDIHRLKDDASVLCLSRYNFQKNKQFESECNQSGVSVDFMSIHKSKGLESDFVIVTNIRSGRFGFPTEIEDDPIISLFLTEPESFPNAEERRLLYVAITRARRAVWLIADPENPSPFIDELLSDPAYSDFVVDEISASSFGYTCPVCEASMAVRSGRDGGVFLGCVFYPRCEGRISGCPKCNRQIPIKRESDFYCPDEDACGWTSKICPECSKGFVRSVSGRNGLFWSCSCYPSCTWTSNHKPSS